jgi:hypothetical protein
MTTRKSAREMTSLLEKARDLGSMILSTTEQLDENVKGSIV